jgi:ketosteroid isomerase-like protein
MKKTALLFLLHLAGFLFLYSQPAPAINDKQQKAITSLIDQYSQARENRDTVLLKAILTSDVDQLVSTGEWRTGINAAVEGMMKSSANSPGTRTLRIEKIQMLTASSALVDCRYEIQNADGTARKMWSTFILIADKEAWKIRAIRNMLPVPNN